MERPLRIAVGLVGSLLVGVGARFVASGGELVFRVALFGRELASPDRRALLAWLDEARGPASAVAAALALGAAILVARRLRRALGTGDARWGLAATALACLALFLAWTPGVLAFVARRAPSSAGHYLDVQDLAHAAGWTLLLVAALPSFARAAAGEPRAAARERLSVALAALVAALVPALLARAGPSDVPLTNDEVAYLFQADVFAGGELARARHPHAEFFPARQIVTGERSFAKYPPGHSAALAAGALVGAPELLPRLFAALAVLATYALARRLGAARPALAAWLLALSPTFLGLESLLLAHGTSLPFVVFFALLAVRALDEHEAGRRRAALLCAALAGACLSVAFAARPLTAVAAALPFAVALARAGRGAIGPFVACALGALPGLGAFLAINHALTGSALRTAYGVYADTVSPDDEYGLVNVARALPVTEYNLARLNVWLHGPALGLLLPLVGLALAPRLRRAHLTWSVAASLAAFYALHVFHGVPWAGPPYLVEGVPLLAIASAQGLFALERALGRRAVGAVLACMVLASAQHLATHGASALVERTERAAPYRAARAASIERGVVLVRLDALDEVKSFPLPPPRAGAEPPLVFARDLGVRNDELLGYFADRPAWRYDPQSRALVPLR